MNKIKVLLIESEPNNPSLETSLKHNGYNCLKALYSLTFLALVAEIAPDIILLNIPSPSEQVIADLQTLNQHTPIPIILFSQDEDCNLIEPVIKTNVAAFIVGDFEHHRLNSIIKVAIARFKQQQLLKNALEEACAKLEDRKQIDRAKAILIKTKSFSEDEAYHTLRKLAMGRNISLGEMAKNVIAMAELLK